jgi:tetratricopeptide (TPR) repeat protein
MMDVLLANVALWRGRAQEAVREGRAAMKLFQEIGDFWGETQATGPVVRALAELGRFDEYEVSLGRLYEVVQLLPDEGMRVIPSVIEACALLQFGHPEAAEALLAPIPQEAGVGYTDLIGTRGLMLLQLGRVDEAIDVLAPHYSTAENDGAAMNVGGRLALAYACAQQADDALRVIDELHERTGGTYHDRLIALWAESLARLQSGRGDARAPVDAAHEIATATDAPAEHAVAALARAHVLRAIDADDADEFRADAQRQLDALGITGLGWSRIFDRALATVG